MNLRVLTSLLVFIPLFCVGLETSAKEVDLPHKKKGVICHKTGGHCSALHSAHKSAPHNEFNPRHLRKAIIGGTLDGSFSYRRKSLAYENTVADYLKLPRFQNLKEIIEAQSGLSQVPSDTENFYVDSHVDPNRRYLQRWTYQYLVNLAADWKKEEIPTKDYPKLKITSLVRDLEYQLHRVRSAAKCKKPETCSTHLTGATFDISIRNMSKAQHRWMYQRLKGDRNLGMINAIHEPRNGCFHVFVIPPEQVAVLAPK